jgi:hypothetical protein
MPLAAVLIYTDRAALEYGIEAFAPSGFGDYNIAEA